MKGPAPLIFAAGGLGILLIALASPRAEARVELPPHRAPEPAPPRPSPGAHAPLPGRPATSSPFGWRTDPFTHQTAFHRGLDIPAPVGTPVYAPFDGVVERIDRDGVGKGAINGNAVIVGVNGYRWCFLHLSSVAVRPGQEVQRGQLLGRSGQTGRATGPHLHVQVYDGHGQLVDPMKVYPQGTFARRSA